MALLIPLAGLALGAAGMYLFDPQQGRRRRALARDQITSRSRTLAEATGAAVRDLRNRARGSAVRVQRWSSMGAGEVPDRVLVERVRAKIGRHVSHPRAIKVEAGSGHVTLRGPVLAHEHAALAGTVRRVRGVREVHDLLQVHERAERISALQGAGSSTRRRSRPNWTPAARALSGGTGAALVLMGLRQRSVVGTLASAAGALMLARAVTNQPLGSVAGQWATRGGERTSTGTQASPSGGAAAAGHGASSTREEVGAPAGWQSPAAAPAGSASGSEPDGERTRPFDYPTPSR